MTDSTGATATSSETVAVQNETPLTIAFTSPANGATVSGSVTVTLSAAGGSGGGYAYIVEAGASTI